MTLVAVPAALVSLVVVSGCGDEAAPPASTAAVATTSSSSSTSSAVPPDPVRPTDRFEVADCEQSAYSVEDVKTGWLHPSQNFYFPGDDPPTGKDIRHILLNDNAVIVEYREDLAEDAREALRAWSAFTVAAVSVPASEPDAPTIHAYISNGQMTCDGVDLDQLDAFAGERSSTVPPVHGDSG